MRLERQRQEKRVTAAFARANAHVQLRHSPPLPVARVPPSGRGGVTLAVGWTSLESFVNSQLEPWARRAFS
jgi:hypothetical protein